ncbi:hypothetical protein HK100_011492 [Physocladia obscura]|uniref:Uncharacterized protein n=1 Tax=Physocladia obscura TaxID=109957 RepID=A0AAD5T2V3_9FUNG|nr:hypothetical protein HK100_011492 [Physocladia obscura]
MIIASLVRFVSFALVATAQSIPSGSATFTFITIQNGKDPTFNQLLGINNDRTIAGYFGSGNPGHPNKGYVLQAPNYLNEIIDGNVPNSNQTQDTCINQSDEIQVGGFWIDANGNTFGFVRNGVSGTFTTVTNPNTGSGTVNQILGINKFAVAAGFYTDGTGVNHGYTYDFFKNSFADVIPPTSFNCASVTATGINNNGDVIGFCSTTANTTVSFFAELGKNFVLIASTQLSTNIQALGINNKRQIVGTFVDGTGNTHGFLAEYKSKKTFKLKSVDHPQGVGGTFLNGINDKGDIVGFYVDVGGNTDGMLLTPGGTGQTQLAPGSVLASASPSASVSAAYVSTVSSASSTFTFVTIQNGADPTFNQLLGINEDLTIAGYFGSGNPGHPNKGYVLQSPNYLNEIIDGNVPNSNQTQDTCINESNEIQVGGFWIDADGNTFGFVRNGVSGTFTTVVNPDTGSGTVNQILGINKKAIAAGFYTDGEGVNHGYTYDYFKNTFADVIPPASFNCASVTATGINDNNDVVGFCATTANTTVSFFAKKGTNFVLLASAQFSSNIQALGINNKRQIVGTFVDGAGNTHGFLAENKNSDGKTFKLKSVDHPLGTGGTFLNGINNKGYIVGFYVDAGGNTDGVLLIPGGTGQTQLAPGSVLASTSASGKNAKVAGFDAVPTTASSSGSSNNSPSIVLVGLLSAAGGVIVTLIAVFLFGCFRRGKQTSSVTSTKSYVSSSALLPEQTPLSSSSAGKSSYQHLA